MITNKTILKVNLVISFLIFAIICNPSTFSFLFSSNPYSSVFAKTPSNCFDAKLTGENEVPSKKTKATGFVELNANNGNNNSMMILYKTDFPSAITNGVLSSGNITSANLENQSPVRNLKDLINLMNNGEVYVHVHTVANPAGEIRGQLLPCNAT